MTRRKKSQYFESNSINFAITIHFDLITILIHVVSQMCDFVPYSFNCLNHIPLISKLDKSGPTINLSSNI